MLKCKCMRNLLFAVKFIIKTLIFLSLTLFLFIGVNQKEYSNLFIVNASTIINSGYCDNLTWTIDLDGVLNISGNGRMKDFELKKINQPIIVRPPWDDILLYFNNVRIPIRKIVINNGVTSIGEFAFINYGNHNYITSVSISDSVEIIGKGAFKDCTGLEEVNLPKSIKSIKEHTFDGCTSLKNITIPNSVNDIEDYVFHNCRSLETIIIPNSVTSIGEFSFGDCFGLKNITLPNSITRISFFAFGGCTNLESITIPNSVTSIETGAFAGCDKLTSIFIPELVTNISPFAFGNCANLKSIIVDDKNIAYTSFDGSLFDKSMTKLVQYVIGKNESEYTIPNGVIVVGNGAFEYCKSISNLNIPDSVKTIENFAFYNCSGLIDIFIPESVTSIGEDAFDGCNSNLCIKGYENSYAKKYAEEHNIKFNSLGAVPVTTITTTTTTTTSTTTTTTETTTQPPTTTLTYNYGDVTGDGVIDATDASFVLTAYAKSSTNEDDGMTEEQRKFADVNKDGVVDAVDASAVLTFYALSSTSNKQTFDEFIKSLTE